MSESSNKPNSSVNASEELLTDRQVAKILNCSRAWCQRKRWEGGGPDYLKLGRSVRYRKSDLLAWIDAHTNRRSTSETD
jgi:predicted DNA-binding transcriptional regulator AlpA